MTPWISLVVSASATFVLVGIAFGALRTRCEQNSVLVKELSEHVRDQVSEIKQTKASTERMDAYQDRLDRFEESLNKKIDEIKEALKELSRHNL